MIVLKVVVQILSRRSVFEHPVCLNTGTGLVIHFVLITCRGAGWQCHRIKFPPAYRGRRISRRGPAVITKDKLDVGPELRGQNDFLDAVDAYVVQIYVILKVISGAIGFLDVSVSPFYGGGDVFAANSQNVNIVFAGSVLDRDTSSELILDNGCLVSRVVVVLYVLNLRVIAVAIVSFLYT